MRKLGEIGSTHDETVDVVQLWSALRQNGRLILGIAAGVLLTVLVATFASRMEFRSTGRLYLGDLDDRARLPAVASGELDVSAGHGVVASEVEIIRSRSLVMRAVLDSGLNVQIAPAHRPRPRFGPWLISGRDPDRLDAASDEIAAKNTVLVDKMRKPREFRIRLSSDTDFEVWGDGTRLGVGQLGQPTTVAGVNLTLGPGAVRGPKAGSEFDVIVRSADDVTDQALTVLQVYTPKALGTGEAVNVVTLEFAATSPRLAAAFLERLMLAYLKERQSWKVEDAAAAEAFVSGQLQSVKESLDQIEKKLADFRSNHDVIVLDDEAKAMIEQIGKYEEQRLAARLQAAALADIQRALKDEHAPMGAYLLGEANDTVLDAMATSLSSAREKLTELETRFNGPAPDVQNQRAQVDAQLDSIRNYVSSRSARAQGTLATLGGIIEQFEKRLKTVPGAELGLVRLSRESEVYSKTYSYLLEREQQAALIKASTLSKNRIIDYPEVARDEDSPKLAFRMASAPLGLLLGALFVVVRRRLSGTLQSETDVRRAVDQIPVFASIPWRRRTKRDARMAPAHAVGSLGDDPNCGFLEAFRTLRTHLYRAHGGEDGKVVLVTSPCPGDGKTTCALSLAAVLAADGKRVLLIDADLRTGAADGRGGETVRPGLSAVLTGQSAWRDVARDVSVSLGGFYWLRSEVAGSPELLSSARMTHFLEEARASFDFVLLDTPAFPLVSDAAVLASAADCVISVLRLRSSSRRATADHLGGLSPFAASHAVVVNDAGSATSFASTNSVRPSRQKVVSLRRTNMTARDDVRRESPASSRLAAP